MTELERLWELSDRIDALERDLHRVRDDLADAGKNIGRQIHVICPNCHLEQPAPVPGDALCVCGRALPHTPEVIHEQVHRATAAD